MQMMSSYALVRYLSIIDSLATSKAVLSELVLYNGMAPAASNAFTACKLFSFVARYKGVLPLYNNYIKMMIGYNIE